MSVAEWAAVSGAALGLAAAVYSAIKVMVKSILMEFRPNDGNSLKDQINRIEARVDLLYENWLIAGDTPKRKREP